MSTADRDRAEVLLAHGKPILIYSLALLLAGAWAVARLPVEWKATVELPRLLIAASWPGAAPRSVEQRVTAPIERVLQGVRGIAGIDSRSSSGQATITVEVADGRALGPFLVEVADRLAGLRRSLPEGVRPQLAYEMPEALREEESFFTLQVSGTGDSRTIRHWVETVLAPPLRSLPGVAAVIPEGGVETELLITPRRASLAAYGATTDRLIAELGQALSGRALGRVRSGDRTGLLMRPPVESLSALRALVVDHDDGRVRLADLARIELGDAPAQVTSRVDAQPAVTLRLDRAPDSNVLQVAAGVRQVLADMATVVPDGLRVLVVDDRSEEVRRDLSELGTRSGIGLLLVLAALWLMMRSARATLIVAYSVTVAVAVALLSMLPLGLTLNALTLAGLVLVVGLLVDNAVIVVEQLAAQRRAGTSSATGVARALATVWLPLAGGTLTTIVLLLPLAHLSGELRALFLPFALLVFLTLGFSLVSAVVLLPVLAQGLRGRPRRSRWRRGAAWTIRFYGMAARWPRATCVLLFLALGLPVSCVPDRLEPPTEGWQREQDRAFAERYNATIGSDPVRHLRRVADPLLGGVLRPFLEEVELGRSWQLEERSEVWVYLAMPPGSGRERPVALIERFEDIALAADVTERTFSRAGHDWALLQVLFPSTSPKGQQLAVRRALIQHALQLAGLEITVWGLVPQSFHSGLGAVSGFVVEAYGPSYDRLTSLTEEFAARMLRDPRIGEVDINGNRRGRRLRHQMLDVRWDAEATARTGVTADVIARALRARLDTFRPLRYADFAGHSQLPVRLVDVEGADLQLIDLLRQSLPVGVGDKLKLADVATFETVSQPDAIERSDQQYKRYVQVFYRGPIRRGLESLDRGIAAMPLPPGYRLERRRATFFTDDVQHELMWLLAGTTVLVFLILAALFESWRLPWIVLISLPLAMVGVAAAFLLAGESLAEGAFIGVILLVGIAVNDSILLVSRCQQLGRRRPRTPRHVLALVALRQRLRPMWTTTLTSIAGMVPLLVLTDGGEFWLGLALTVVGGLLASTLLAPAAMVALSTLAAHPRRGGVEVGGGGRSGREVGSLMASTVHARG